MVTDNTDNHETAFTVSVDHKDTTTGISAVERGYTARKCVQDDVQITDFRRPGHMFPLRAKEGGVLVRNGHTEATVDLMRLAGLKECGLCCEIMRDDGTMMRMEEPAKQGERMEDSFYNDCADSGVPKEKRETDQEGLCGKYANKVWNVQGIWLYKSFERRASCSACKERRYK